MDEVCQLASPGAPADFIQLTIDYCTLRPVDPQHLRSSLVYVPLRSMCSPDHQRWMTYTWLCQVLHPEMTWCGASPATPFDTGWYSRHSTPAVVTLSQVCNVYLSVLLHIPDHWLTMPLIRYQNCTHKPDHCWQVIFLCVSRTYDRCVVYSVPNGYFSLPFTDLDLLSHSSSRFSDNSQNGNFDCTLFFSFVFYWTFHTLKHNVSYQN